MSEGVWHQEGEGEEEGREREEKGGEMSVLLRPFFFLFLEMCWVMLEVWLELQNVGCARVPG